MTEVFTLLTLFQIKHWLCDYPLQTPFMLQKFQRTKWIVPLACHAWTHALFTMTILSVFLLETQPLFEYTKLVLWLGVLDFTIHFVVDRVKAHHCGYAVVHSTLLRTLPDLGGRYKMDDKRFWWSLGADQMLHHFTHYLIIGIVLFT